MFYGLKFVTMYWSRKIELDDTSITFVASFLKECDLNDLKLARKWLNFHPQLSKEVEENAEPYVGR